jgi:hypothetical protein
MPVNQLILNAIVDGELTFRQIAEKYNVSLPDVEMIFEEYMSQLNEYYN